MMVEVSTQAELQENLITSNQVTERKSFQENKQHDFYQTTEQPSLVLDDSEIDIIIEIKHPKSVIYAADKVQSDSAKLTIHLLSFFLLLCLI